MPLALLKQGQSNGKILGLLFLEAAVIFAGITGSFWIEEWRQNREDLDVYHHLLEEIYYNAVIDESRIPMSIADNNLAIKNAINMAVLDSVPPRDTELWRQLNHIFGTGGVWGTNTAGYVRLSNTSLSIPFDETMIILDDAFNSLSGLTAAGNDFGDEIAQLRATHWESTGMVSCTGVEADDGSTSLMDRPYMTEIRELLYPDGECITQAENERRARELIADAEFRNALKRVINLRQGSAWLFGWQADAIRSIKSAIETRLPDVSLPIVSMELVSWPAGLPTERTERRTPMQRSGPHTWEVTLEFPDGFVKFRANDEWSVNWGAPFPNIIDAPGWLWSSDQVAVDDVFPSGSAHLHGMNMPVRGGNYRVTFDSQTFEYAFEEVEGS
ncbi:MAG: hypothetical protein N2B05_06495 [Gemmatimonadales bacterium]